VESEFIDMKYYRVKPFYSIREETNKWIIFDTRIEKIANSIAFISKSDYLMFHLFDGSYSYEAICEKLEEKKCLSDEYAKATVNFFLDKFGKYIEEIPRPIVRNDIFIKKNAKNSYRDNIPYYSNDRLDTPLFVSIILTKQCFVKCKYCFASANEKLEREMELDVIKDIICQCKDMGVATINLSGGDPFARNDIYEILKELEEKHINYNISTKKFLMDMDIEKLKNADVRSIQLSIDSNDDEICNKLIGISNFYSSMKEVIKKLIKNGIKVKTNTVITKYNIDSIPELVDELIYIGVSKIYLSPYLNSLGRHKDDFFCNEIQYNNLVKKLPDTSIIDFKPIVFHKSKNYNDIQTCSGGKSGLVIYNDGSVGICERLIQGNLQVGNVYESSLYDIWKSEKLREIIEPSRELFVNTECYDCSKFKECIYGKGICYVRAKINSGKYYSIDPFCPKSKSKQRMS